MLNPYRFFFVAIPFLVVLFSSDVLREKNFEITVSNIQVGQGKVIVEIYHQESDWFQKPYKRSVIAPDSTHQTVSFQVPYGSYAIAIYQDINENNELDRRVFGIPKEPVGFGNNYKPFGKPDFQSASVEHSLSSKTQEIKLYEVF